MNEDINNNFDETDFDFKWEIDSHNKPQRNKKWYIIAGVIALGLIVYAIIDKNYFFALILIISSALIIFFDNEPVKKITFAIKYDGVLVDNKFFSFESINNFYIIYRPKEDLKRIYFEFKNPIKHRLSIELYQQNPLELREYLLKYIEEDPAKNHEPLSEGLSKLFRL